MSERPKVPLLQVDPQLGRLVPPSRLDAARSDLLEAALSTLEV